MVGTQTKENNSGRCHPGAESDAVLIHTVILDNIVFHVLVCRSSISNTTSTNTATPIPSLSSDTAESNSVDQSTREDNTCSTVLHNGYVNKKFIYDEEQPG